MGRRKQFVEYIESFWNRVDSSGDCWLWTGQTNNKGYGIFCLYEGDVREKLLAHRFSALMAGLPVRSPKDVVMHQCDTPPCVRPQHLSVGTQADNMRDALLKNRSNLTGLTAPAAMECRQCGSPYRGLPASRYCDACKQQRGAA